MPVYRDDPENPGKPVDVIELQKRNPLEPLPPHPEIIGALLKRDSWQRREAILILAGYDPDITDWPDDGMKFAMTPNGRVAYLDGTMAHQLQANGLTHPMEGECLKFACQLQGYSKNERLDEKKSPQEWIEWAESKEFKPYWLDYWRKWQPEKNTQHDTTIEFPTDKLSLWQIAFRLQNENPLVDSPPLNVQDELIKLAQAVLDNRLWVTFLPGRQPDLVPVLAHCREGTFDKQQLSLIFVRVEDWKKYEVFFGQPLQKGSHVDLIAELAANDRKFIDWQHWLGLPFWTPEEAVSLLMLYEPGTTPRNPEIRKELENRTQTALREKACGKLPEHVLPSFWTKWAKGKGWTLPSQLDELANQEQLAASPRTGGKLIKEEPKNGNPGMTTGDIAMAFDGIFWTYEKWKKNLADYPIWMKDALIAKGQRGVVADRKLTHLESLC